MPPITVRLSDNMYNLLVGSAEAGVAVSPETAVRRAIREQYKKEDELREQVAAHLAQEQAMSDQVALLMSDLDAASPAVQLE